MVKHIAKKDVYSKYTKNSTIRKKATQLKWAKDQNRRFAKEGLQMTNRQIKICSTSYIMTCGNCQLKQ